MTTPTSTRCARSTRSRKVRCPVFHMSQCANAFGTEERIYDDDDLPVDGREQWELIEDEVGWAVKKKAPLVKEGYLRRKSRLRFGKWKTLYAVLDKEHRYYAYYKKVRMAR